MQIDLNPGRHVSFEDFALRRLSRQQIGMWPPENLSAVLYNFLERGLTNQEGWYAIEIREIMW